MKTAFFSTKPFEKKYYNGQHPGQEIRLIPEALGLDTVSMASGAEAVCIFTNDDCSAPVLEKLKTAGIKGVAIRAAGYDQIDLKNAQALGIAVANVPEYSPYSIAEHAVALILALNRRIIQANRNILDNNFLLDQLIGFDMNVKTVGITGVGKIGTILAKILNGFGCRLIGFDVQENKEVQKYGLEYVTLTELFHQSDIISLHAPLHEHTRHMINHNTIAQMKEGVMIINTGRGGLVNTADAIEGIKSGKIGALGLNVYEKEKGLFFFDHTQDVLQDDLFARLLTFKNVLVTGHQAFLTENALRNIADTTLYNLECWSKGQNSKFELYKK